MAAQSCQLSASSSDSPPALGPASQTAGTPPLQSRRIEGSSITPADRRSAQSSKPVPLHRCMQAPSVHVRQIAAAVPQPPGVRACARPLAVELAPARNHVLRPLEPVLILQGRAMGSTVVRKVKGVGRGHQGCGREPGRHSSLSPHGVLQGGPARAARACHHHMGHTPPGAMQTCSSVSSVWRRSSMLVCWSNLRGEGAGRSSGWLTAGATGGRGGGGAAAARRWGWGLLLQC